MILAWPRKVFRAPPSSQDLQGRGSGWLKTSQSNHPETVLLLWEGFGLQQEPAADESLPDGFVLPRGSARRVPQGFCSRQAGSGGCPAGADCSQLAEEVEFQRLGEWGGNPSRGCVSAGLCCEQSHSRVRGFLRMTNLRWKERKQDTAQGPRGSADCLETQLLRFVSCPVRLPNQTGSVCFFSLCLASPPRAAPVCPLPAPTHCCTLGQMCP